MWRRRGVESDLPQGSKGTPRVPEAARGGRGGEGARGAGEGGDLIARKERDAGCAYGREPRYFADRRRLAVAGTRVEGEGCQAFHRAGDGEPWRGDGRGAGGGAGVFRRHGRVLRGPDPILHGGRRARKNGARDTGVHGPPRLEGRRGSRRQQSQSAYRLLRASGERSLEDGRNWVGQTRRGARVARLRR